MIKNLIQHIQHFIQVSPDKPAFVFLANGETEQARLSYAELDHQARQISAYLQQKTDVGDRIILSYLPGLEFISAFLGCLYAGRIAVPAYPLRNNQHAHRLLSILEDCNPRLIFGTHDSLKLIQTQLEFKHYEYVLTEQLKTKATAKHLPIKPASIAFLQYTSGSTGQPKGVMVSHANIMANLTAIHHFYRLSCTDNIVSWLPMQHDMGLVGQLLYTLYCGTTEIFMPPAAFLEKPIRWLQAIERYKGYAAGGPNFGYALCVERISEDQLAGLNLAAWKIAFNGSEPIRADTLAAFAKKFKSCKFNLQKFQPCYGMAETTLLVSGKPQGEKPALMRLGHNHLVSSGHVYKSYSVKIVNPDTKKRVKPKETGEIWIHGPCVALGYWNKKDLNKNVFQVKLSNDKKNYLRTGDLGYVDGKELYIAGRLKDLIILQGRNVYPHDVEAATEKSHHAIRIGCTAAFSIESNQQEQLIIVAEIKRTHRKMDFQSVFSEIRHAVQHAVDAIPYNIIFISPATAIKTTSGKIQRQATKDAYLNKKLKILAEDHLLNTAYLKGKSFDQIEADINIMLAKILAKEKIDPQTTFSSLGGTSLEAITFQNQLQNYVGHDYKLSPTIAFDYPTVATLAAYLHREFNDVPPQNLEEKISTYEPIAIIGMSCSFPGGADNPEAFWKLLEKGSEAIVSIPETRWKSADYPELHTQQAGLIDNITMFDAGFFNISPREAETMDPQQRLLLEETWKALECAGLDPEDLQGSNTSVFIGATSHDYADLLTQHEMHDSYLLTGNVQSVLSGRISYALGLQGPCITVNTACSSSLVAVQQASVCLQSGDSDLAIVGGVNALLSPQNFINLSAANMLASDGRCKVFSENADGYVRGEGCGVVILKKLSAAIKDENPILGVIKSAVINQDGASSGLTVPNGVAQEKLLLSTLKRADLNPSDIQYIETHGTGTKLGDPMETHAIAKVYQASHTADSPLMIGAVKANIGHLEAAAGIAGLIKVLASLKHHAIPPQPTIDKINSKIDLTQIPAKITTERTPWLPGEKIRRAIVSSFGFSGTNAQVLIEEPPKTKKIEKLDQKNYFLFPLSAKDPQAFADQITSLQNYLLNNPQVDLGKLSYTLQENRQHFAYREAFLAKSHAELKRRLIQKITPVTLDSNLKVSWVFSDVQMNMPDLSKFQDLFPDFEYVANECKNILRSLNIKQDEKLKKDLNTFFDQFVLQYAISILWKKIGVSPHCIYATGLGIYAASVSAGVLTLVDAIRLLIEYASCCLTVPVFQRALVVFSDEIELYKDDMFKNLFVVTKIYEGVTIISGPLADLQLFLLEIKQKSIRTQWISLLTYDLRKLSKKKLKQYSLLAKKLEKKTSCCAFFNANGDQISFDAEEEFLNTFKYSKINYQAIKKLTSSDSKYVLEIGSDSFIAGWLSEFISDRQLHCFSSLEHDVDIHYSILKCISIFYKNGMKINRLFIHSSYKFSTESLIYPTYPFQRQSYWVKNLGSHRGSKKSVVEKNKAYENVFYQTEWISTQRHCERSAAIQAGSIIQHKFDNFDTSRLDCRAALAMTLCAKEVPLITKSTQYLLLIPCDNFFDKFLEESSEYIVNQWQLHDDSNLANFNPSDPIIYFAAENLEDEYTRLLKFIQKLAEVDFKSTVWIITHQAYSLNGSKINLNYTPLNGLIKTARLEYPQLNIKQIDVENHKNGMDVLEKIKQEHVAHHDDALVAYRDDQRYSAQLSRMDVCENLPVLQCIENAYYLITGGLGAIGFSLVAWLIQKGAKNIILAARTLPTDVQRSQIENWENNGIQIFVEKLDLSDKTQVHDLLQRYKHGLHPLKGVFHLAGSVQDAPLTAQTQEHFTHTFAGKAQGAWNLHESLEKHHILLDYFILFSSIASLAGSPNAANYAAANAYLDGLAYYRRFHRRPAISINWGPWAIGMAKKLDELHTSVGFTALNPQNALQFLEYAMLLNPVNIGIFEANWQKILQHLPSLQAWAADIPVLNEETPDSTFLLALQKIPYDQRKPIIEEAIVENLKHILNLSADTAIDTQQSFFTFGLDSLMGLQLINRLQEILGDTVSIKYEHVLQKNTVSLFADYLHGQIFQEAQKTTHIIPRVSRQITLPMSFAQERLWFLQQLDPFSRAYSEISALEIKGILDKERVEYIYQHLIQRHECLRTRFIQKNDLPIQVIEPHIEWHLNFLDLREFPLIEHAERIKHILNKESSKPFNLAEGPLFRAILIQLSDDRWIKAIVLHHIIADGWSIGVMIREFGLIYNALNNNQNFVLTPLPIQYADYSVWQREYFTDKLLASKLEYWKNKLAGAELLNLPLDYPRPNMISDAGRKHVFIIPNELLFGLKELAKIEDVSLYMVLLSTLYVFLARYSGQDDICIGSPIANRTRTEVENIIGFFVNMIVLRISTDMNLSFSELLKQVKQICLEAYAHQDASFEKIVEALVTDRDTSRTPLFDVMLVLQNTPLAPVKIPEIEFKLMESDSEIAKFDLTFEFLEINNELHGTIEYRSRLFKPETIDRMAQHFLNLLKGFVNDAKNTPAKIEFLTGIEQKSLLIDWNNTHSHYPKNLTAHEMFLQHVFNTPNATAIEFEEISLSYFELNCKANQLGHYLLEQRIGPEIIVGICMDRSVEMIIAILAILKAGGVYMMIDPAYPADRIEYMLADAQVKCCLSCEPWANLIKMNVINLDQINLTLADYRIDNPTNTSHALNAAYVIYTSGSTGKPKGVVIQHQSLINFIFWFSKDLNFVNPVRYLFRSAVGFDVSVSDIFFPLLTGGVLVVLPPGDHLEPRKIVDVIKKHNVTSLEFVPGQLLSLLDEPEFNHQLPLQGVVVGGEALTSYLVNVYYQKMQVPLFNTYGPSETTIISSANFVLPEEEVISIGNPIANTQYYVLDKFNNLAPLGVAGELCIAGEGLARGYLNRPELNAEKFITFLSKPLPDRMYRTGDQVRYLMDGKIEFLGRFDHQIKIRGYRIECGEIENVMNAYPGIEHVIVSTHQQENRGICLVAYMVLKSEIKLIEHATLRTYLKQHLPDYMVPTFFIFLEQFPLNASGKIDRKSLPAPDKVDSIKTFIAPRNNTEKIITSIFQNVLNMQQVSIEDNFFECGGHSLLAVKVINQLRNQLLDENIPLSILFQYPTPRQIAESILNKNYALPLSDILCLQSQGNGTPLFLIPGTDGYGLAFVEFARQFQGKHKVYCLQHPGLFKNITFKNIDELASFYVSTLRAMQPKGPYAIFGWSMGGIVAYAMAKLLQESGETLQFLGIADIDPCVGKNPALNYREFLGRLLSDERFGLPSVILPEVLKKLPEIEDDQLIDYAYKNLLTTNSLLVKDGKEQFAKMIGVFLENELLLSQYSVEGRIGHLHFFNAKNSTLQAISQNWQAFTDKAIETYTVEGDHFTMLQAPQVNGLAQQVIKQLL